MKYAKRLFDFYLDASIHVAFAVLALMEVTAILLNISIDRHLKFLVFFGTMTAYNFVKYGVEAKKYILVANRYHKNIQFFSIIALIIACYSAFYLNENELYLMVGLFFLTGLYAVPLLPHTKNLRNLAGLKVFIVALVWAGVTVVLPSFEKPNVILWDVAIEVIQRILLVLILLVPFEIRDLKYDAAALKTIPQRFGAHKTLVFGGFLAIILYGLTFLKEDLTPLDAITKGVLFLILGHIMLYTKKNQNKYYASFWVEAIPIFWWISILLVEIGI
ncbi:hypothetical protein Celal_0725 [Cellulophaga algicola DSM 14237]|uniref:UbiA prenyltransferase n=1 Tax=Cellulophaga algicola (strain DSM 14237 / IC166 / ACAM 630) TaxID=688270 RepID=E6XDZ4_CELAD|nr:hypothetical protein [Cellulophaga algicola]ADV48060.1 hypothetical protein Celal_0725 [Cellulophaga algicola DSM 14237]